MSRELTKQYFENKAEQSKISIAILEAIPKGVRYHNLVAVLAELLQRFVIEMTRDDVFGKSVK